MAKNHPPGQSRANSGARPGMTPAMNEREEVATTTSERRRGARPGVQRRSCVRGMVRSVIACRENERPMSKRSKRRALMNNSVRALAMNERERGGIATRTNESRRGARRNVQRRSPTGTARSPDCAALCGNPPRTLVRRAKRSAEYHCHATGFGRSSDRIRCTRR